MDIKKVNKKISLVIMGLVLVGCNTTPPDHYYWGRYEQLLYNMYIEPGSADAQLQIDMLVEDIQKSQTNNKPVPPGVYAHLGYMYAIQGNIDLAEKAFAEEKENFPESSTLIDGMLERAHKALENKEAAGGS